MTCRLATLPRTATLSAAIVLCTWTMAIAQTPALSSPAAPAERKTPFGIALSPKPFAPPIRAPKAPGDARRLWTGALVGTGIGLGLGLTVQILACEDECVMGDDPGTGIAVFTGIGAAIGLGIGALMNHNRPSPTAAHRTTIIGVAPMVSKTRRGLAFSMTWR